MRVDILSKIALAITLMLFPAVVFASKSPDDAQKAKIVNKAYRMRVPFIENRGQLGSDKVSFYAKTFGGTLFVEKGGVLTYSLPDKDNRAVVLKEIITDKKITIEGLTPSPTKVNYFKGKDKSKWRTNIPSYESVSLGEIYKGIDLTLRAYGNNVEKLFTVLPGVNPEIIKIKLQGAKGLEVNEKGELEVITEIGAVKFTKPLAYQEINGKIVQVDASYNLINSKFVISSIPQSLNSQCEDTQSKIQNLKLYSYGFKVGNYDKKRPLVIDPLLASTFVGGGSSDLVNSIALDGSGDVYVTGRTSSYDYPTTTGAYDESHNVDYDVFVSKLNSSLSSLLASTFMGGGDSDQAYSITIDGSDIYITGYTESPDYPTTTGAYDESHNGDRDVFVSKLNSSLSSLSASTFIGGDSLDEGRSIALDGSGDLYVTGRAESSDYPTTTGAYDESYNGDDDVFISRLNSTLSTLSASTFIGDVSNETGRSIALDESGDVYVTGYTWSSDYPTTSGAYDENHNGGTHDVFVSKLDSTLSYLLKSTFIGGSACDDGLCITLKGSNVYVTGQTFSTDYPITAGAYDQSWNGGNRDVFISKLNSTLSTLSASTFIGGNSVDFGNSIALDVSGDVYVTGGTYSSDYPTTEGAYDESHNGSYDVFVSKLDSALSYLLKSTFMGGGSDEYGYSLALDGSGDVYVTGYTKSSDYPTTPGAYDESFNGGGDAFVSKLYDEWCIETVDTSGGMLPYTSIAVDSNSYPHISYSNTNLKYSWAEIVGDDISFTWHTETVDTNVGECTSLAIGGDDIPRISYYDASGDDLEYAYKNGSWNTETVESSGDVGEYNSIAVDSTNNPHISYYDKSGFDLKYAYYDGSWHIETVDSSGDVGKYNSIALDSANKPHISYYDASGGNLNLKYAYKNVSWQIETVESSGDVGWYTSIAVDSANKPHISYGDNTLKKLKYAKKDVSWDKQTVDSIDGMYPTSIDLDRNDYPHIAYQKHSIDYAYYDGSWHKETVDSGTSNGGVSLIIACRDSPSISYCSDDGFEFSGSFLTDITYQNINCGNLDRDNDGHGDCYDNCPDKPNGPGGGTCVWEWGVVKLRGENPITCFTGGGECGDGICDMEQGDCNENGIGDVCECYTDFSGDGKVFPDDAMVLLMEWKRKDCSEQTPCQADIDGDGKVFPSDAMILLGEWKRKDCPVIE